MHIWSDDALAHGTHWPHLARYQQACDQAFGALALASELLPFTADVPTVVCVVHNEERRLPAFLQHYKQLGARSIHIVDHASTDRSAAIAAGDPAVTLWKTQASYAGAAFGQHWVAALARRFGLGRWVLNVDADEFLVYTDMLSRSLADLQHRLQAQGSSRLFTPLVDLYINEPLAQPAGAQGGRRRLLFDARGPAGNPYQVEDTPFGPRMTGGPRARMMAAIRSASNPWLSKFALSRWDADTAYANVHFPYPFERNRRPCVAALLHLKLVDDFGQRVADAIVEGQHYKAAEEYKAYQRWLQTQGSGPLAAAGFSAPYKGPESLVQTGIMDAVAW